MSFLHILYSKKMASILQDSPSINPVLVSISTKKALNPQPHHASFGGVWTSINFGAFLLPKNLSTLGLSTNSKLMSFLHLLYLKKKVRRLSFTINPALGSTSTASSNLRGDFWNRKKKRPISYETFHEFAKIRQERRRKEWYHSADECRPPRPILAPSVCILFLIRSTSHQKFQRLTSQQPATISSHFLT